MSETRSKETTRTRRDQLTGQVASSVRIGACDDRHNVLRRYIACHGSPSDGIWRYEAPRRVEKTGQGIGEHRTPSLRPATTTTSAAFRK